MSRLFGSIHITVFLLIRKVDVSGRGKRSVFTVVNFYVHFNGLHGFFGDD